MFTLIVTEKGGQPKRMDFEKDEITIGRVPGNDVILPKGNVSKRHSRVVRQDGRFFVVDLKSTNGTYLNGRRITTPSVIRPGDKIYVGDFVVTVDLGDAVGVEEEIDGAEEELEPEGSATSPPPAMSEPPDAMDSSVEPLPLDQEPPDSSPPPPNASLSVSGRVGGPTLLSPSGPLPPPRGAISSPSIGTPSGSTGDIARPTQPPPGRAPLPARTVVSAPISTPPPAARPPVSQPALGRSPAPLGGPPMGSPSGAPAPLGAPPMMSPPAGVRSNAPIASPPGALPSVDPSRRSPSGSALPAVTPSPSRAALDDDDEMDNQATSFPAPSSNVGPATSPAPAQSAPLGAPPLATVSIAPAVVDAVIQSHRASAQAPAEPVPPGRDYASALADVITEAKSNGAPQVGDRIADAAARARTRTLVESIARGRQGLPAGVTAERLARDATAEIAGAGAIETALEEPEVTTVMVESSGRVLVGRGDALGPSPLWFSGDDAVTLAVDRLLHAAGRPRNNETVIDAIIADGARLLAVLPPSAPSGPTVIIERPPARVATLIDLVAREMLNQPAATALTQALAARRNIIVTGPRGSGRSTVLGALTAAVSATDRCVLVEGRHEIARGLRDVTAIDAQSDWKRAMDIAGRLLPQRLVINDSNDATAAAFITRLATGAEGSLIVAEGASPSGALNRLATLAASVGAIARDEAISRLAVTRPVVVHLARLADGRCRVVSMGEARFAEGGGLYVEDSFALRVDGMSSSGRIEASLVEVGSS